MNNKNKINTKEQVYNQQICRIVEAITPTTYATALRVAKAMTGVDESRKLPPPIVGQKQRHY